MKIDTRTIRDVCILDCSGKITLGESTMSMRNTVKDALQGGAKKILLNLSGVTYIDSAGVGDFVGAFVTAGNNGAKLKLLGLTGELPRSAHDYEAVDGF